MAILPSPAADEKCDDLCRPPSASTSGTLPLPHLLSCLPFILTFSLVSILVLHRLFPALCGPRQPTESRTRKRLSALAFSTTLGSTAVLAELILCEVSDWVAADARKFAFRVTIHVLLICLIIAIPLLELYSLVENKWSKGRRSLAVITAFGGWVWLFWNLPIVKGHMGVWASGERTVSEECLARVGVVGVSLMALLSGFGCVSTPWQNFGAKEKTVSDNDIARTSAGLDATSELLITKTNKLRYLERKISEKGPANEGIMSKVFSAVRGGDADTTEKAVLIKEISGLETMRTSLAAELADFQRRLTTQQRAKSLTGRILKTMSWGFSIYCLYRIAATTIAHLPIIQRRRSSFSQSDPINNILALLAVYWDPHLDRAAWSRQIGFLLSGVIIAGSLGSVMTTVNMLMRVAPGAVTSDNNPNLPLFVSQLSAVYVLASALLLRSNLPASMSTVLSESLGAPLDPKFVDMWFDSLFLGAAATTAVVIVVLRRIRKGEERDLENGMGTGVGTKES